MAPKEQGEPFEKVEPSIEEYAVNIIASDATRRSFAEDPERFMSKLLKDQGFEVNRVFILRFGEAPLGECLTAVELEAKGDPNIRTLRRPKLYHIKTGTEKSGWIMI
jgi:hypothetical protein